MKKFVLGIDVGGTNTKFGLINSSGRILARSRISTKGFIQNRHRLISAILKEIDSLIKNQSVKKNNILGVGIGLPGLINPIKGIVHLLPNIPHWKDVPLKKILERFLRIPVFLENDVNLITLGEWKFGAGVGCKNLICMTIGTGIGGGLILDNKLYRGESYAAGELGHMPLNEEGPACGCGGYGCFERYVGNQALQKNAAKILNKKNISLEEVSRLAFQGNKRAIRFYQEAALRLGNGLIGAVNLLNPCKIILGGGVSKNFKFLYKTIYQTIKMRAMTVQAKNVKIVQAKLGDDAGLIGARVLVYDLLFKS